MTSSRNITTTVRTFLSDTLEGFLEIIHNSFALLGLTVALAAAILVLHPDLRTASEEQLHEWLQERQVAERGFVAEPDAIERITALNPKELPKEQATVTSFISKRYRVAPPPLAAMVAEAYELGKRNNLDPTLILAVVAIESRFNPYSHSPVGAQGLMQVMTGIHADKYQHFGGKHAAFDPVSNMRVGVSILKNYIRRAGSVEGGLKYYVGAANQESDNGYTAKVMAEYRLLRRAIGKPLPAAVIPVPAPLVDSGAMTTTKAISTAIGTESVAVSNVKDDAPTAPASSSL